MPVSYGMSTVVTPSPTTTGTGGEPWTMPWTGWGSIVYGPDGNVIP